MTKFSTIARDQIQCHHFPLCSGCEIQNSVTLPPIFNEVKEFFNSIDPLLPVPLHSKEIIGWRSRSKLAVRGTELNPQIGLFKKGTHRVISIPDCPVHDPAINEAYQAVRRNMLKLRLSPYCEEDCTGILRYLQFVVERRSGKVQLTLVVNCQAKDPVVDRFARQLYKEEVFLAIWVNYQPKSTNRIFGEQWELLAGEPYLVERLCGIEFSFHPGCFAQAHLPLFEQMLKSIQQSIRRNSRVVELYAGVGVIGVSIAHLSQTVICSEINPHAEECFYLTRLRLAPELQKRLSFVLGSVEQELGLVSRADVLIVDPPRKGLSACLLNQIVESDHLQQLIYVSCQFDSFRRDCRELLKKGWKIVKAETYLLFPGVNHVETLCMFTRS